MKNYKITYQTNEGKRTLPETIIAETKHQAIQIAIDNLVMQLSDEGFHVQETENNEIIVQTADRQTLINHFFNFKAR